MVSPAVMQGNEAIVEAAITAGCRFFAGYPITPASEIIEKMAQKMPMVGGVFLQMEDEISSIAAAIGASLAGAKSMTATSGPGFSLMQENLGLAVICEVPLVIVNVMRGGPSTGQPTRHSQGDVMQAKWGTHGDHEVISLAPWSVQECFDLTIEAFNLSEEYRVPVILLSDAIVSHMRENLKIPLKEKIKLVSRRVLNAKRPEEKAGKPDKELVYPMHLLGEGTGHHYTGLTHDRRGYPTDDPSIHRSLVERLCNKIRKNKEKICKWVEENTSNANIVIASYGSSARAAMEAWLQCKKKGVKAGFFRLITINPFPSEAVRRISKVVDEIFVVEANLGQVYHLFKESVQSNCNVSLISKIGGEPFTPTEILSIIRRKKNN